MIAGDAAIIPELGPLLGRLVAPPAERSPLEARFDQIRLDLLTELFERARAAREVLALGDTAAGRAALGGPVWLEVWGRAVAAVTRTLGEDIERRLREAAAASRYPKQRLALALPDPEAQRLLAARLSAAGIGLEEAAEGLGDPSRPWSEALRRIGGELEASWERLLTAARGELATWSAQAAAIAAWRRPWRPLLIAAALLFLVACWLGLVLGGYLSAPSWLRPLTDWVWNL